MKNIILTDEQKKYWVQWAEWLEQTPLVQYRGGGLYKDNRGYCCLGIWLKYHNRAAYIEDDGAYNLYLFNKNHAIICVYDSVYQLTAEDCALLGLTERMHTMFQILNDTFRYTFAMIAKEIRHIVEYGEFIANTQKVLNKVEKVWESKAVTVQS